MTGETTPTRELSTGSPQNLPLFHSLAEKSPNSSPRDSNPAKDSFLLLDLLEEVKNVSTALVEFKCQHDYVNDAGIKHLEVMMESLECIYDAARKQVGKISTVKYLKRAYDLSTTADRKRKAEDPMLIIRSGAVYGLRKFVKKYKITDAELTKIANSPPQPMLYY